MHLFFCVHFNCWLFFFFFFKSTLIFLLKRKFSIIRGATKKGHLGWNTEGSLGFLPFSSSSKQRALCWHSSGVWAQPSPARGAPLPSPPAYSRYVQYIAGHFYSCLLLFLCFYDKDTAVRNDGSRVIIQAAIESRCFVLSSRSPVLAPDAPPVLVWMLFFSCYPLCLPVLFPLVSSSPHYGNLLWPQTVYVSADL